jgi:hypothetical protein
LRGGDGAVAHAAQEALYLARCVNDALLACEEGVAVAAKV